MIEDFLRRDRLALRNLAPALPKSSVQPRTLVVGHFLKRVLLILMGVRIALVAQVLQLLGRSPRMVHLRSPEPVHFENAIGDAGTTRRSTNGARAVSALRFA